MEIDQQTLEGTNVEEHQNPTETVLSALAKRYSDEFFVTEFRNKPSGYNHRIDAFAIWLHPSRSDEVECFEIKSSRNDWLKEFDNVEKADEIAKHCDRIWLVTSNERIARLDEIPKNWGWMYLKNGRFKVVKEAPKMNPIFDRNLLITVAQEANSKSAFLLTDAFNRGWKKGEEHGKEGWLLENERSRYEDNMKRLKELEKERDEFQKISGIVIGWYHDLNKTKQIIDIAEQINDLHKSYGLDGIESGLNRFEDEIAKIRKDLKVLKSEVKTEKIMNNPHNNMQERK